MFFKSIRFKIILWYTLVLALTLSAFSFLLYQNYSRGLYLALDQLLFSKAEGVVSSIESYWEAEKLTATQGSKEIIPPMVFSKINNLNFARVAKHTIEERSGDPALLDIVVKVFDSSGYLIAASANTAQIKLFTDQSLRDIFKGHSRFDNFTAELIPGKSWSLRIFSTPVVESGRIAYIVQVASPLNSLRSSLNNLKTILFLLLPTMVLFTGIVGAFFASITLKPVGEMMRTIREIRADNLKLRINIPDTKDEIKKLADTFNDMLAALEQSFLSQQQFIQDLSHELRTPLTILQGEIEVTLKKIRTAPEYETVLLSSLEEINAINRIVEDLLFLARFDNKRMSFEFESFDLKTLLKTVLKEIEILAQQKGIKMNIFANAEKIIMKGDENQIKRLLINLMDNAIKYNHPQGMVDIDLREENFSVKISVRDNGIGIPVADLPHIFDRFYRVNRSRSSKGYGLGLSIAKSIVDAHHGTITVESLLAQGTTFTVSLPLLN